LRYPTPHNEGPCSTGEETMTDEVTVTQADREATDLIAKLVEALRKSNSIIEALADNDLDEPIADNSMTVGAALQYEAPKLAFSNCALLVKLSEIGTQVSDKAGFQAAKETT